MDLVVGDIIVKKIVSNRTNKNRSKQSRLSCEYVLPSHNIKYPDTTVPFLRNLLELHKSGYAIGSVLFAVSRALLGTELSEYKKFDSGLVLDIPEKVKHENDLMGSVYQYLTPKDARLSKGTFYTNASMTENIVSKMDIKNTDVIFDPACGSGNLLFNSKIKRPEQIIGVDFDELAVMCCKVNYYLKFGLNAPSPKIFHDDFFKYILNNNLEVDYVLCNPPFGATIDVSCLLRGDDISTEDSLTYFVEYATPLAKKKAVFILPESVINVKKHTDLRAWILNKSNLLEINSYGANFSGTMFPIITLSLDNNSSKDTFIYDGDIVKKHIITKIPYSYFRPINRKNEILLSKVFKKNKQSLLGSVFGLGIVTGDNKKKVFSEYKKGAEPVITGKDINKYNIKKPTRYIFYDRDNLQQVAPDALYRNKQKIIYKTVSRDMIFALDTTGTLTLNSANFFIPKKDLTISVKCLLALLNSRLYDKLNKILYGENKISRTNLENLPIPDIDIDTQKLLERFVDAQEYGAIDAVIDDWFGFDTTTL